MMAEVFEFLANLFAPIGQALGLSWPVLQWVLLGLLVLLVCLRLGYDLVITPSDLFSVIGTADQGGH